MPKLTNYIQGLIEPQNIPTGWSVCLLDEVAKRGSGHTPDRKIPHYWDGGIKWVSLADSDKLDKVYIAETAYNISNAGIANSSAVLHTPNTVILSRDAGIGKSAILAEQMAVSQHFIAWTCGSELDYLYLYYWLQVMKPEFERIAVGSTIKTIGLPFFKKLTILLPPLPEQRAIAAILSTWDDAIALTSRLIDALKRRKQALMQRLLTGQTRFPEFAGEEWEDTTLAEVAKVIMGQSPSSENYNSEGNGLPLIQGNADIRDRISAPRVFTTEITKICEIGDILLSVRAPVGETARSIHQAVLGRGVCAIRAENVEADLLYQLLLFREPYWTSFAQGSTFTAINSADIKAFALQVPPNKLEQDQIAEVLSACDEQIGIHQKQRTALQTQKRALMQRLLTGQVRVKG